jgi:hypothetical protein
MKKMTKRKLRTVKVSSYRKRGHKIVKKGRARVKKYIGEVIGNYTMNYSRYLAPRRTRCEDLESLDKLGVKKKWQERKKRRNKKI